MTRRIPKSYLLKRFEYVASEMQWDIAAPIWTPRPDGQGMQSRVGAVFLQPGDFGGWRITQIANEHGGERDLTGHGNVLTARELDTWFSGILLAKSGERS